MIGGCVRDLEHKFDATSGWCLNGCGWRDDGRSQYWLRTPTSHLADFTGPRRTPARDEDGGAR